MSKAVQRTLEAKLAALEANPDGDSSSDEEESGDEHMEDVKETTSRKSTLRNKKDVVAKKDSGEGSNVIYLGHLPRGFEEHELRQLLKQFGKVIKLRLVRSKRTGNSRGYAFCQFPTADVAAIVAETFSGYLVMGQHRLVCHVVASDRVHRGLFQKLPVLLTMAEKRELHRKQVNQPRAASKMKQITAGLLQREVKKRNKLKALGIDYFDAFPGFEASAKAMLVKEGTEETTVTLPIADASAKSKSDKAIDNAASASEQVATKSSSNKRSRSKSPSTKKTTSANDDKGELDVTGETRDVPTTPSASTQEVSKKSSTKKGKKGKPAEPELTEGTTVSSPKPRPSKLSTDKKSGKEANTPHKENETMLSAQKKRKENSITPEEGSSLVSDKKPDNKKERKESSGRSPGNSNSEKRIASDKKAKKETAKVEDPVDAQPSSGQKHSNSSSSTKDVKSPAAQLSSQKSPVAEKKRKDGHSNTSEATATTTPAKRRKEEGTSDKAQTRSDKSQATHVKESKDSKVEERKVASGTKKNKKNSKKRRQSAP